VTLSLATFKLPNVMATPGVFGNRLRSLRGAAGLSQEELAERAGLSAKAVSALERGERTSPRPHTVRVLARALDLSKEERAALVAAAVRAKPAATPRRPPTALELHAGQHAPDAAIPEAAAGEDAERGVDPAGQHEREFRAVVIVVEYQTRL
jgi:transcriptional regulator with XRE-family HTH domain